jgi:ferredoxin
VENIENKLRESAKRLFEEKKVDVIVGYEQGTLPFTATPCFITVKEEADRLVWNTFCVQNLAKYVTDILSLHKASQKRVKPEDRKKKVIGVVARGCTTRSIVMHLQEKQYERDEVVVIGIPCTGYVDRKKLASLVGDQDIIGGGVSADQVSVRTSAGERKIALKEVLADNCRTCRFNNPVLNDLIIGEAAPPMNPANEYGEVEAFEKLSKEERWAYFSKEMAKCIRCYACRQACPSCYCPMCFIEQSQPNWVGVGEDATDTQVFQLMRIFHMVGRCVDCGSCVAVCPMGVDLRKFLKKLDKDVFELFENRAGSSLDDKPPLSTYKDNDKEDFIYHP